MFALFKCCFFFLPLDVLCVLYAQIFPNPLAGNDASVLGILEGAKSAANSHLDSHLSPLFRSLMLRCCLSITLVTIFFLSAVRGEAGSEARAPGEQRGRGRRRWRGLGLGRRVVGEGPLLQLRQAGPVLRDGDGALRPAAQAPSHRDEELPSGQPEVDHAGGALPEEGGGLDTRRAS